MKYDNRKAKRLRVSNFITQSELALASHLDATTVSRIEKGEVEPRLKTIRKIAEALGVHPSELMKEGEEAA